MNETKNFPVSLNKAAGLNFNSYAKSKNIENFVAILDNHTGPSTKHWLAECTVQQDLIDPHHIPGIIQFKQDGHSQQYLMSNPYYNYFDLFISSPFATAAIKFYNVTLNELNF